MDAQASGQAQKDKTVTFIVNGRQKEAAAKELSYEDLVNFAFDNNPPTGEFIVITVTFSKGDEGKKEGSLLPGESVKVKDGMVFNVTATDKS